MRAFIFLSITLLSVGCSKPSSSQKGPDTGDAWDLAGVDAAADAGNDLSRVDEPFERPVIFCEDFNLVFEAGNCSPRECEAIECECVTLYPCLSPEGCLLAADCDAVCAQTDRLFQCIFEPLPPACTDDASCGGEGFCIVRDEVSMCAAGFNGSVCLEDADCVSSNCVANRCSDGSDWSDCLDDGDCHGNPCIPLTNETPVGACSGGVEHSPCANDDHCSFGWCHPFGWEGSSVGACRDGRDFTPCRTETQDRDCAPGFDCRFEQCFDGTTGDICVLNDQCKSSRCAVANRLGHCVTGALGDNCDEDADCESGICIEGDQVMGEVFATCTSGGPGAGCADDDDCLEGRCARGRFEPTGVCSTGQLGARCSDPEHCVVGECVTERDPNEVGMCTDGAGGSPCYEDANCAGEAPRCLRELAPPPGTCVVGDPGDPCFEDGDCFSGVCSAGACAA